MKQCPYEMYRQRISVVHHLANPLSQQTPINSPGKAAEAGPSPLASPTQVCELEEVSGPLALALPSAGCSNHEGSEPAYLRFFLSLPPHTFSLLTLSSKYIF